MTGRGWAVVGAVTGMALLWLLALAVVWTSPFFVGSVAGAIAAGIAWLVVLALVVTLGWVTGRRWLAIAGAVVTLLLAVPLFNWSACAPRTYFEVHRPLYDRAVATASTDDSYYGAKLPFALRPLAVDGRVTDADGMLFFAQWMGIPDDAGGYFWSPGRSPEGADMFGMPCAAPEDLGGGWWACGMSRLSEDEQVPDLRSPPGGARTGSPPTPDRRAPPSR